ncbi:Putative elongation of fatty acids protein DDB_G0272012 [Linum grandiflorum]
MVRDTEQNFHKSEKTFNGNGTRHQTDHILVGDTGRNFKLENGLNGHKKLQSPLIPPLPPGILRLLTALHNTILLTVSFVMALGCLLAIFTLLPTVDHLACFAKGTPPRGPLFFWGYVFYLSKIYEYIDTLLIILSSSMSRRLSFLHVYHHATVVVMCYISLHTSQSMYPGVLVTNSAVHVVMYFYYLLCSLGMKPKWKKIVTDCQIVQFYISFGIMGWIFYVHFTGSGCSGIWGWCFDAVFIATLLYLFLDFHKKTYSGGGSKKKASNLTVNGNGQVNGVEVFDFVKPLKQA